jgi:anti-anti-sigma factor
MVGVGDGRTPPPDAIVRYHVENREGAAIFHCKGALVLTNFQRLDELIRDVKQISKGKVVLDVSQVDRIDSVGIGTLSMILKHAMTNGLPLRVVSNDYVRQMLGSSGLDRVFQFSADIESAVRSDIPN